MNTLCKQDLTEINVLVNITFPTKYEHRCFVRNIPSLRFIYVTICNFVFCINLRKCHGTFKTPEVYVATSASSNKTFLSPNHRFYSPRSTKPIYTMYLSIPVNTIALVRNTYRHDVP